MVLGARATSARYIRMSIDLHLISTDPSHNTHGAGIFRTGILRTGIFRHNLIIPPFIPCRTCCTIPHPTPHTPRPTPTKIKRPRAHSTCKSTSSTAPPSSYRAFPPRRYTLRPFLTLTFTLTLALTLTFTDCPALSCIYVPSYIDDRRIHAFALYITPAASPQP